MDAEELRRLGPRQPSELLLPGPPASLKQMQVSRTSVAALPRGLPTFTPLAFLLAARLPKMPLLSHEMSPTPKTCRRIPRIKHQRIETSTMPS